MKFTQANHFKCVTTRWHLVHPPCCTHVCQVSTHLCRPRRKPCTLSSPSRPLPPPPQRPPSPVCCPSPWICLLRTARVRGIARSTPSVSGSLHCLLDEGHLSAEEQLGQAARRAPSLSLEIPAVLRVGRGWICAIRLPACRAASLSFL